MASSSSISTSLAGGDCLDSYRLFLCGRCQGQVKICTYCDRGNRYCSRRCSSEANQALRYEAGRRYQKTERGRANHAARQQRYLIRKMTHPGSSNPRAPSSSSSAAKKKATVAPVPRSGPKDDENVHPQSDAPGPDANPPPHTTEGCHFCGKRLSAFARRGFVRFPARRTRQRYPAFSRPERH